MSQDVTPGNLGSVPCPRCGGPVFFTLAGGPNEPVCPSCRAVVQLDVVHDGRRWTVRRVRASGDPPSKLKTGP